MLSLEECLAGINTVMRSTKSDVWKNQINTNKPLGSFGTIEKYGYKLSSIIGTNNVISNKATVIFAGDHGIADMNLSVYDKSQTRTVVSLLAEGETPLNKIINQNNIELICVDIGVNGSVNAASVLNYKLADGTQNMYYEKAIEEDLVVKAIETGIKIAGLCAKKNVQIVALGEVGIGNTVSASVLTAILCNLTAEEVTGRGTGIIGDKLNKKREVVSYLIDKCTSCDPIALLAKYGGYEICGDVGFILGCSYYKLPVVLDGFITGASALVASKIHKDTRSYMFASHQSSELGHEYILKKLELEPMLNLGMRYGLATGASLALPLYERAYMLTNV